MSFKAMKWAVRLGTVGGLQKLTLIVLADCMNEKTGQCTPSLATLSSMAGIAKSTVQKALKELESAGLISRSLVYSNSPSGRECVGCSYRLNIENNSIQTGVPPESTRIPTDGTRIPNETSEVYRDTVHVYRETVTNLEGNLEIEPLIRISREQASEDTPPTSDENVEVQTEKRTEKKRSIDPQVVLDLFVKTLPELPKLRGGLTESRKTAIEARAKDAMAEDGVTADELEGWFRDFFESVRRSSFLMGRKTEFIARFDWLMKKANAEKVLSGNYEDRKPTRGGGKNLPDTSTIDYEDGLYE